jgi:hypothetical protein
LSPFHAAEQRNKERGIPLLAEQVNGFPFFRRFTAGSFSLGKQRK